MHYWLLTLHADPPLRVLPGQPLEGRVLGRAERGRDLTPDGAVQDAVEERVAAETGQQEVVGGQVEPEIQLALRNVPFLTRLEMEPLLFCTMNSKRQPFSLNGLIK